MDLDIIIAIQNGLYLWKGEGVVPDAATDQEKAKKKYDEVI